jgi:hypothetical protein
MKSDPKPENQASDKLSWRGKRGPVDEHEEDTLVAKKGHTEEQILRALGQAEGGSRVADICREHGLAKPRSTFGRRSIRDWA